MVFRAILDLLGENKRLPYYAAERRIDLFINLFLEDILSAYYGEKVNFVVPEFPLKHEATKQADKLDYLCAFDGTGQPIFVELKTDAVSFKAGQAANYVEHAACWPAVVARLAEIVGNSRMLFTHRVKYSQLVKSLHNEGLIVLKDDQAEDAMRRLAARERDLGSRRKKTAFSRDLIDLCQGIGGRWDHQARLLYLVPSNPSILKELEKVRRSAADKKVKMSVLDFGQLTAQEFSEPTAYPDEFQQLAQFLAAI